MGDDESDTIDNSSGVGGGDGACTESLWKESARAAWSANKDGERCKSSNKGDRAGGESKAGGADGVGKLLRAVDGGICCGDLEGSKGESGGEGIDDGDSAGAESSKGSGERGRGDAARTCASKTSVDSGEDEREDAAECREYGVRRL